ncbi:MAG TPA: hypothetical protein PK874_00700 [Desulfobacteraceae bacterium]|nr:hypothetical protein [Desulfobacteraceae bacterium]HPJ68233.1 hypothetical protein [Desulfobacteraceae bacterium]
MKIKVSISFIFLVLGIFLCINCAWSGDLFAVIGGGKRYKRTVVVSPVPGNQLASGNALLAALNNISGQSATNTYLLKIEPGIYELSSTSHLIMKEYVDIEGSGELNTIITRTGAGNVDAHTLLGANNAELRFLTVRNTGDGWGWAIAIRVENTAPRLIHVTAEAMGVGGGDIYGIYCLSGASPVMKDVTARATGGGQNFGIWTYGCNLVMDNVSGIANGITVSAGMRIGNSNVTMIHCTSLATGGATSAGIFGTGSSQSTVNIDNCTISGSGGTNNYGILSDCYTTVYVTNSQISGSTNTIKLRAGSDAGRVGSSLLDGGPVYTEGGATCTCAGVSDGSYTFYPDTCPPPPPP